MITLIQPLHIGNALRVFLKPPAGAVLWRVLRKETDDISGPADVSAFAVYQGDDEVFVDSTLLANGVQQFYRAFWTADGATWNATPSLSGTPAADYQEYTPDVMTFLRERLEAGLLEENRRGTFLTELEGVQVIIGSPSMERDLRFPLVTLHLESESDGERALGEAIAGDYFDSIGFEWNESEGWWSNNAISVIGWSTNAEERNELRKALRRVLMGNMQVFEAHGWTQIGLRAEDIDAVNGEYPAPLFQTLNTFTCIAPVRVGGPVDPITQVFSRSTNA